MDGPDFTVHSELWPNKVQKASLLLFLPENCQIRYKRLLNSVVFFSSKIRTEPRTLNLLDRCSIAELNLQTQIQLIFNQLVWPKCYASLVMLIFYFLSEI